jgi:hypothetical protein
MIEISLEEIKERGLRSIYTEEEFNQIIKTIEESYLEEQKVFNIAFKTKTCKSKNALIIRKPIRINLEKYFMSIIIDELYLKFNGIEVKNVVSRILKDYENYD